MEIFINIGDKVKCKGKLEGLPDAEIISIEEISKDNYLIGMIHDDKERGKVEAYYTGYYSFFNESLEEITEKIPEGCLLVDFVDFNNGHETTHHHLIVKSSKDYLLGLIPEVGTADHNVSLRMGFGIGRFLKKLKENNIYYKELPPEKKQYEYIPFVGIVYKQPSFELLEKIKIEGIEGNY